MAPRKSRCDVPSGTTQRWVCLNVIVVNIIQIERTTDTANFVVNTRINHIGSFKIVVER